MRQALPRVGIEIDQAVAHAVGLVEPDAVLVVHADIPERVHRPARIVGQCSPIHWRSAGGTPRLVPDLLGQGVSYASAPLVAASPCKPIRDRSVVSIRSVSPPLLVVSLDALGIWKGILGWRGHLKGWPARNEFIAHGLIDAGPLY